jgi:hypothetical protein
LISASNALISLWSISRFAFNFANFDSSFFIFASVFLSMGRGGTVGGVGGAVGAGACA